MRRETTRREERSDSKVTRIQENISHPRPNIQNLRVLRCFGAFVTPSCKFKAAKPGAPKWGAFPLKPYPGTANPPRLLRYYCGGELPSPLLDAGGGFLSFVLPSPLNTPTILPKKPFFFFTSSDWTPVADCWFPFADAFTLPLVVGGGSAFSEFPPKMREKNPGAPA